MNRKRVFQTVYIAFHVLSLLLLSAAWVAPLAISLTVRDSVLKPTIMSHEHFNINNINCAMSNNGKIVDDNIAGSSGMEWPKGTGKTLDFASGLWLAGIGHDDGILYTACPEYRSELVPGPWGENPNDEAYRIYKINKDSTGDWEVWPGDQGAPVDSEGKPVLIGDQTLFWVSNDGDTVKHSELFGTPPMNVEIRHTVFGFNRDDALGNTMFVKWEIINKGTQQFDSCFVALWDDPDLGGADDDLVGCDTTMSLGYCYNRLPTDWTYGTTLPALGFDLFQGPEVPQGSGNHLPMTVFVYILHSSLGPFGDPITATQAYGFMNGYGWDGTPYTNHLGEETRIVFAGDPVTGTGHLDGVENSSCDRRFLISSGPFTLAPGDTQVVVGAKIVAQGFSNLDAVAALRAADRFVQSAYDNDFVDFPSNLAVNVAYPNSSRAEILIQVEFEDASQVSANFYDHDDAFVTSAQLFDDGMHHDQNPNDDIWGNSLVLDRQPKPLYMNLNEVHLEFGTLNWPQMKTNIITAGPVVVPNAFVAADNINGDGLVNPGEVIRYTFEVKNQTAFNLQNVTLKQYFALESDYVQDLAAPNGNKVFPTLNVGQTEEWTYHPDSTFYQFTLSPDTPGNDSVHVVFRITDDFNVWYDTLSFFVVPHSDPPQHGLMDLVSGAADSQLGYTIINPTFLTGHTYRVYLHEHMDELKYDLVDQITGAPLLSHQEFPDYYGFNSPIVDGFKVTRGNASNIAYAFNWYWEPQRWLSWVGWGGRIFGGAIDLGKNFLWGSTLYEWEYKSVRIEFDSSGATTTNCKVYRSDLDYAVQAGLGAFNGAAYDVSDRAYPRQLNIVFVENDIPEKPADMVWDPDSSSTGGGELLFIMNSDYDPIEAGGYDDDNWGPSADVIFVAWLRLRDGHTFLENTAELMLEVNPNLVHDGDVFEFTPIFERECPIPTTFALEQNYPNPFNQVTTIQYAVPTASRVKLIVYNVLGQRLTKLVDEVQEPGIYWLKWDAQRYASGLYFCRLTAGNFSKTIKMVLLK